MFANLKLQDKELKIVRSLEVTQAELDEAKDKEKNKMIVFKEWQKETSEDKKKALQKEYQDLKRDSDYVL